MARVLYRANIDKVVVCFRCKSVVEYEDKDVQHWTDSDGPGGCGAYHEYIDCPSCGRSVDID